MPMNPYTIQKYLIEIVFILVSLFFCQCHHETDDDYARVIRNASTEYSVPVILPIRYVTRLEFFETVSILTSRMVYIKTKTHIKVD